NPRAVAYAAPRKLRSRAGLPARPAANTQTDPAAATTNADLRRESCNAPPIVLKPLCALRFTAFGIDKTAVGGQALAQGIQLHHLRGNTAADVDARRHHLPAKQNIAVGIAAAIEPVVYARIPRRDYPAIAPVCIGNRLHMIEAARMPTVFVRHHP